MYLFLLHIFSSIMTIFKRTKWNGKSFLSAISHTKCTSSTFKYPSRSNASVSAYSTYGTIYLLNRQRKWATDISQQQLGKFSPHFVCYACCFIHATPPLWYGHAQNSIASKQKKMYLQKRNISAAMMTLIFLDKFSIFYNPVLAFLFSCTREKVPNIFPQNHFYIRIWKIKIMRLIISTTLNVETFFA